MFFARKYSKMDLKSFLYISLSLIYTVKGKSCPENVRPHSTRCDSYFKCVVLPSKKSHVWVPLRCDRGLVYEPNLKTCVLPGDDWECSLETDENYGAAEEFLTGDKNFIHSSAGDSNRKVQNIKQFELFPSPKRRPVKRPLNRPNNNRKPSFGNKDKDTGENQEKNDKDYFEVRTNIDSEGNIIISSEKLDSAENYESSGDGNIYDENLLLNDGDNNFQVLSASNYSDIRRNDNFNGDNVESRETLELLQHFSKVDPKLSSQLQRLSQLVDGLKNSYHQSKKNSVSSSGNGSNIRDLRPDQLNAFLAHFNLKSENDDAGNENEKQLISEDGKIPPSVLKEILGKQERLKNLSKLLSNASNKINNATENFHNNHKKVNRYQNNNSNSGKPNNSRKPTVVKTTDNRNKYGSNPGSISSSQILINRPEGSVLFNTPPYLVEKGYETAQQAVNIKNEPHISEDTLKTVLELSKQMVSQNNIRQVIPNNGLVHSIVQPLFYSVPLSLPSYFGTQFPKNTNSQKEITQNESEHKYTRVSSSSGYSSSQQNDVVRVPSSGTIIQNNIIPVHITGKPPKRGTFIEPIRNIYDSYGNEINPYIDYPPYTRDEIDLSGNNNNNNNAYSIITEKGPSQMNGIQTLYTPSPHLDDSNAHNVLSNETRFPTISYATSTTPSEVAPNSNSYLPYHYAQGNEYHSVPSSPIFPSKIKPSQVNIHPNSYSTNQYHHHQQQQIEYPIGSPNIANINENDVNQHFVSSSLSSSSTNLEHLQHHINQKKPSQLLVNKGSLPSNNNNYNAATVSTFTAPDVGNQLVNVGGNFVSFDIYKNQLLSAFNTGNLDSLNNIEVISCSHGVRQPNTTDCNKYYVCSKTDEKVISYSCPPYTAFNAQTRICDAKTYAICNPDALYNRFTVTENKKIQMEAIQALQEAKRIRDEAIKAQNLANLIRLETQKVINNTLANSNFPPQNGIKEPTVLVPSFVTTIQQQQEQSPNENNPVETTTNKIDSLSGILHQHHHQKRKKYYCKEGDKIPDQNSMLHYFVCFKTKDGVMKGHRMSCPAGLMFCAKTAWCTMPRRCNL